MRYRKQLFTVAISVLLIGTLASTKVFADRVAHTVGDHEQRIRILEQAKPIEK